MMEPLLYLLTYLTRGWVVLLKLFGKSGTALPGLWVERYWPSVIGYYADRYTQIILITGTNGKTTTQHTLSTILRAAHYDVVHNASGSNMLRGIAASLLLRGPVAGPRTVFICETEEGTMPRVTRFLKADIIIITNLFRDQLDAYGELHTTARYIQKACTQSPDATLIINADDPSLSALFQDLPHQIYRYGLADEYRGGFAYEVPHASPAAHPLSLWAQKVHIQPDLSSNVTIEDAIAERSTSYQLHFLPPGLYNVSNMLAAYLAARIMGLESGAIGKAIETVTAPFGRGEVITVKRGETTIRLHLFLVKNPAGFGQVWQLIQSVPDLQLIIGLNDHVADGRDVSWIWDINLQAGISNFHPPAGGPISNKIPNDQLSKTINYQLSTLSFTGRRAHDMALRFKYAEIHAPVEVIEPDIGKLVDTLMAHDLLPARHPEERRIPSQPETMGCFAPAQHDQVGHSHEYTLLMTYTAMNKAREHLRKYTPIRSFHTT